MPEHLMQMNTPKFTDAHRGPFTPQSAQNLFSATFKSLRKRFKFPSQSSPAEFTEKLAIGRKSRNSYFGQFGWFGFCSVGVNDTITSA